MRKLTRKQKTMLTKAIEDYKRKEGKYPLSVDDFDYQDVVLPIDNVNPCEIFWQNANRFITDYVMDKRLSVDELYPLGSWR